MGIDEGEVVLADTALRFLGQLGPARADIDPGILEPPQERACVADIEILLGEVSPHLLIVEREHFVMLLELEMKQALVPPHVVAHVVAAAPSAFP